MFKLQVLHNQYNFKQISVKFDTLLQSIITTYKEIATAW